MTKSIGHKKDFWENFKFLLKNAVTMGIYKPVDYKWHILGYDIPWWGGKRIWILPTIGLVILLFEIL